MRWSFFVETVDDWVYYGVKCCGGGMFRLEAVLMWAYGKVGSDYGVDGRFEDFSQWRKESDGSVRGMKVGIFVGF